MNLSRLIMVRTAAACVAVATLACGDRTPTRQAELDAKQTAATTSGWEKIHDRPADSVTSIDMVDDDFGLAVLGHTLQRTDDGGRSWQQIETAPTDLRSVVAADRLHWWTFDTPDGMMRTDDGGISWRPQDTGTDTTLNGFSVVNEREAWATAYDVPMRGLPPHGVSAFMHTLDGGDTWSRVELPGYGIFLGVWFVGDDGWVIATQCQPGDPIVAPEGFATPGVPPCDDIETLLHTGDAGQSWEMVAQEPDFIPGSQPYGIRDGIMRVDQDHAFAVCTRPECDVRALYATTDGGHTWQQRHKFDAPGVQQIWGLRFASATDGWVALARCTIPRGSCDFARTYERTTDGGLTWETIEGVEHSGGFPFDVTFSSIVVSDSGSTGISSYDPSSRDWRSATTNAGPEPTRIEFTSRDVGHAYGTNGSRLTTTDGGATWLLSDQGVWWAVVPSGVLARWPLGGSIEISDDDGGTWRAVPGPNAERRSSGWVLAVVGDRVWVQLDGVPWRTDDAGRTWHRLVAYGEAAYHFIDEQHAWISPGGYSGSGEAVLITENGGDTWTESRLPQRASEFVFRSPSEGWGVTRDWFVTRGDQPDCLCVISTHDGGRSWETVSTAPWQLRSLIVTDGGELWGLSQLNYDPAVVVTSSDGGATWREDFQVDGAFPAHITAKDGRLWLYYSLSQGCYPDGPCDPPRRTVMYRREIGP